MSMKTLRPWMPVALVAFGFLAVTAVIGLSTVSAAPEPVATTGALTEGALPGPDVTVRRLSATNHYGESGGIHAYSVGTDSCNIGSEPVNWCDNGGGCTGLTDAQHPVIAQNMYRLADGRFEQIGMSWLKHGFLSLNTNAGSDCQGVNPSNGQPTSCVGPPRGGNELGIGCTDLYGAGLNGSQPLGRRSEVNAATGAFPFPPGGGGTSGTIGQRIQVAETDLTVAGARYWVEGHYVADDDALAGNGFNNASYREVSVNQSTFDLSFLADTVREQAAIFAWQAVDPEVEIVSADYEPQVTVPKVTERFNVARRVTYLGSSQQQGNGLDGSKGGGGDQWRYVYAIHNMNSNRSAREFGVSFPGNTQFSNIGFRDVDHHSNEPYDTTDWTMTLSEGTGFISWSTDTEAVNANANALRWGTMFTFWFDADRPPTDLYHEIGLFKQAVGETTFIEVPFSDVNNEVFTDGFESGNTLSWSSTVSP